MKNIKDDLQNSAFQIPDTKEEWEQLKVRIPIKDLGPLYYKILFYNFKMFIDVYMPLSINDRKRLTERKKEIVNSKAERMTAQEYIDALTESLPIVVVDLHQTFIGKLYRLYNKIISALGLPLSEIPRYRWFLPHNSSGVLLIHSAYFSLKKHAKKDTKLTCFVNVASPKQVNKECIKASELALNNWAVTQLAGSKK